MMMMKRIEHNQKENWKKLMMDSKSTKIKMVGVFFVCVVGGIVMTVSDDNATATTGNRVGKLK